MKALLKVPGKAELEVTYFGAKIFGNPYIILFIIHVSHELSKVTTYNHTAT